MKTRENFFWRDMKRELWKNFGCIFFLISSPPPTKKNKKERKSLIFDLHKMLLDEICSAYLFCYSLSLFLFLSEISLCYWQPILCLSFFHFQYTDEEVERCYEEFYEDVHTEFLKYGEIVNFKVGSTSI